MFAGAKETVAKVFETSSKTKLLMAVGVITLADSADLDPATRIQWQALAGIAFIVSQGFKEAFTKKA